MMLFMDLATFTLVHVVISVFGILAGLVVVGGLISNSRMDGWTGLFLSTTLYTTLSGFLFPFTKVTPAHVVGVVSLPVLVLCLVARYGQNLRGSWRAIYVLTAVAALYLNVFVLLVQLFAKTPPLAQLAPTPGDPPFAVTQAIFLVLFAILGRAALRGFRGTSPRF